MSSGLLSSVPLPFRASRRPFRLLSVTIFLIIVTFLRVSSYLPRSHDGRRNGEHEISQSQPQEDNSLALVIPHLSQETRTSMLYPLSHPSIPLSNVAPSSGLVISSTTVKISEQPNAVPTHSPETTPEPVYNLCRSLPGADDVVLVVKTGGTEVYARVLEQLLTLSRCVSNLEVYSDLEQQIGDFHIHDALDEVSDIYKDTHQDFKLYKDLKRYHAEHRDITGLGGGDAGWHLDKWKNIPILHKVQLKYPEKKWFVFIDADTYISWTNLLQLLAKLDHRKPYYLGARWMLGDVPFAQGGTGYVISQAAAETFQASYDEQHVKKWELTTSTACCGDVMQAMAFLDVNISITPSHPLFQPDPVHWLEFTPGVWCVPAITWHHVPSYQVEALWQFEQSWINQSEHNSTGSSPQTPYLYRDAFDYFVSPHIETKRSNWNNLSRDRTFSGPPFEDLDKSQNERMEKWNDWAWKSHEEKQKTWDSWTDEQRGSAESPENCRAVCEQDKGCRQYLWRPKMCSLNWNVRLGQEVGKEELERVRSFTKDDREWVSEWMTDRTKADRAIWESLPEKCQPKWTIV